MLPTPVRARLLHKDSRAGKASEEPANSEIQVGSGCVKCLHKEVHNSGAFLKCILRQVLCSNHCLEVPVDIKGHTR